MKRILTTFLPVVALCAATTLHAQSGVVDQSELHDNVAWNMGFFNDMQQEVHVGVSGTLDGFRIRMATQNVLVGLNFDIFLGNGAHAPGTPADWSGKAFATQVGSWEWVYVDCSSAGLHFDAGDVFVIRAGDGNSFATGVDLTGNSGWPNPFYVHPFWEAGQWRVTDRLTFETYVVPDPSILTVSGTCGSSMTFDVTNGTGNYWLVYGNAGSSSPGGIDLAIANPSLATTMGSSLIVNVPAGACGMTVQAVDMEYRVASNPVVL